MEKFKAFATKRIYGVPVLAFIAIFMAGLLWYAIKLKPAEPEVAVTDATAPEGDGGLESQPVFSAKSPASVTASGASVTSVQTTDTNELYGKRVVEWLISQGTSYSDASGMVSKWLSGESLTVEEDKLRSKAIAHFGLPPESVVFAPIASAPAATSDAVTGSKYANNAAWGSDARDYLQGGGASVGLVTAVLNEYLEERPASYRYHAVLRDQAIAHLGLPPNPPHIPEGNPYDMPGQGGVEPPAGYVWNPSGDIYTSTDNSPAPVFAPSPAPTPPASKQGAPPLVHVVKGNGDTSYRDLAMLYFGSTAFELVQRMRAQDRNIGKEGPFAPGTNIKIPSRNAHYYVATSAVRTAAAIAAKNAITVQQLNIMNPQTNFPVTAGTRVQVG